MSMLLYDVFTTQNTTGWTELLDINPVGSVYAMFTAAWGGWFLFILFALYIFMLYMKTHSSLLVFTMSGIFTTLYLLYVVSQVKWLVLVIMIAALVSIIMTLFYKGN